MQLNSMNIEHISIFFKDPDQKRKMGQNHKYLKSLQYGNT